MGFASSRGETAMEFSARLKEWRHHRRMSQAMLAGEAGISARHLSFLETGRSHPTRGMVLRLAERLAMPLAERNVLLASAGFAPHQLGSAPRGVTDIADPVKAALDLILQRHMPFPAVVMNSAYDYVTANAAYQAMAAGLGVTLGPGLNLLSLLADPAVMHGILVNGEAVVAALMARARSEAWLQGPQSRLSQILQEIENQPGFPLACEPDWENRPAPVVEVRFRAAGGETGWITTISTFGSPADAYVEGLFIEQFFPADEETAAMFAGE